MKKLIFNLIKRMLIRFSGGKKYQNFFEEIYLMGINGMNYGYGGSIELSGEKEAMSYIKNKLNKRNPVIFDVGANIGKYSKALNEVFDGHLILYSFEPSVKTFNKLQETLAGYDKGHLNQFGFGAKREKLTLFTNEDYSGIASVYNRRLEHFNINMDKTEAIEIQTIDEFCRENNIAEIDFLKLDIEGHELSALKGADQMIRNRKIKFIQFEFGGCNIDSRTYFQDYWYLLNKNYIVYRIVKDGLCPINSYKETYELFSTINYLAELR